MILSFKTWAGSIALGSLVLACGASTSTPEGAGGTGGSRGSSAVVGTGTGTSGTVTAGSTDAGSTTTTVGAGGSGGSGGQFSTTFVTTVGTGGQGGAGGAAGGAGGGGPQAHAIALLNSQLPADENRRSWLVAGEELRPNTLVIAVNTVPLACAAPGLTRRTGSSETLVVVGLPEAMQKPGTYPFSSNDVIAWGRYWLGTPGGGGGGLTEGIPLEKGTIEIVSIDAASIDIRFIGLEQYFAIHNRAHTVVRCP